MAASSSAKDGTVHVGDDGWLFLIAGTNSVQNLYKPASAFTQRMVADWISLLRMRTRQLAAQKIQYLHLPAPEKLTVLHRHSCNAIDVIENSPIRQLTVHRRRIPCLIDPLPSLEQSTENQPMYWKTDTHWSFWGCYAVYRTLCDRLKVPHNSQLPNYPFTEGMALLDLGSKVEPEIREQVRFYALQKNSRRIYANSLMRFKEDQNTPDEVNLHVGSHVVYRNDSPDVNDQCVILFGDSFSECRPHLLTGMLAETFREVHFIWNASIDHDYIREVQPDIVITELAERFMTVVPDDTLSIRILSAERLAAYQSPKPDNAPPPEDTHRVILKPERYALTAPGILQPGCNSEAADTHMEAAPIGLRDLRNPRIFFDGGKCLIIGSAGETIHQYGLSDDECQNIAAAEYPVLAGTTLLLGASMGAHCYYHWMVDVLPRLGILQQAGIAFEDIDHYLVRETSQRFQLETLSTLGIDRSRIIETRKNSYFTCDRLLHVDLNNGINLRMHRFVPAWINHNLGRRKPSNKRIKLYASRPKGVRRGVSNEAALIPHLKRAGYTIATMEKLSVARQADLFSRADTVISPHGGALTNMLFCRPGTRVVELFGRHVYPFYYGLSQCCNHEYHAILESEEDFERLVSFNSASAAGSAEVQRTTRERSFKVSPDLLLDTLQRLDILGLN